LHPNLTPFVGRVSEIFLLGLQKVLTHNISIPVFAPIALTIV
jgi:hypothetical protein